MPPDDVFAALADPTRRAICERLSRGGEQTVGAPTERAGVSQPAVWVLWSNLVGGRRAEDEASYRGASYRRQRYVAGLERVAAGLD